MPAHRLTARRTLLALAASAVLAAPAAGAMLARGAVPAQLVFPVVGKVSYGDDFGDPRWQGGHEGNDIVADRKAPVVAVEAGRVVFWTRSSAAGCMLYLYGRSGTMYLYIHLNNDLTAKNDNRGSCVPGVAFAPGLVDGQTVKAGELIGYVGNSGDADGIHPHLHFELHPGGGKAVSPYPWLQKADPLAAVGAQLAAPPAVQPAGPIAQVIVQPLLGTVAARALQ
jgi:murein DD-endopeptidase MepM/ murein hydrolase activator NlpD